jgi:hypothetical protein
MEPPGEDSGFGDANAGEEVGASVGATVMGAATGRLGMLRGGGPANLGGKDGSGEFSGLAIVAIVVSLACAVSTFFGGTGGSGALGCVRGSGLSRPSERSSVDSNSKVGRAGGAGRAFEKRDRPDFGGCRVEAPIISTLDSVAPA